VGIERNCEIVGLEKDGGDAEYPVWARLAHLEDGGREEIVKAKYLFAADGGKGFVRRHLGIQMIYKDPSIKVWGVVDGVFVTDYPDSQVCPSSPYD
jgi:2-polyprenyl-6-methoxyphenol hydroxylase-like FAD-dependent oxidoreductase